MPFYPPAVDAQAFETLHGTADSLESTHSRLFELLLAIAWPVVEHYRSDLYHDATWIRDNVQGSAPHANVAPESWAAAQYEFFYGVRQSGTSIGTEASYVAYGNAAAYRVTLRPTYNDDGSYFRHWRAEIVRYR